MDYLIAIMLGIVIGGYIVNFTNRKHEDVTPSGTFIIDLTDPMKDVCRLDLSEDLNFIYSKSQIVLDVKTIGEFTQD